MKERLIAFLKQVKPFELLSDARLGEIADKLQRKEYPKNTVLFRQNESWVDSLAIVYSGEVEKYYLQADGTKAYLEHFSEYESFGAISLILNFNKAIRSVVTLKDTVVYELPGDIFHKISRESESFSDYYVRSLGKRMLQSRTYANILTRQEDKTPGFESTDHTFTIRLEDIYTPHISACHLHDSIKDVASMMTGLHKDYALVMDRAHKPVGIVTDDDFRAKVVSKGISPDLPVWEIMSTPVMGMDIQSYAYEAVIFMMKNHIQHLLVSDGRQFKGIVTLDQLLDAHSKSPFLFILGIAQESGTEELYMRWARMPMMVERLLARGIRPEIVNPIISAVSDAIAHNVILQALDELGPAPVPFTFMVLGSEGRKEQTLSTDQDNAIIFEDVPEDELEEVQKYFLRLGTWVSDALNQIGFKYCDGELMASNPKWVQPLSKWKENYNQWISQPFSENVVIGGTFFDCRSIYGDVQLLDSLRAFIFLRLKQHTQFFFSQMTKTSLLLKPPLTLFKNLRVVVEDNKKGLNIKKAMTPIVDFARIYALKHEISETNTGERLQQLHKKGLLTQMEFNELFQAYYFMMRLRLSHQINQIVAKEKPDNIIDPKSLSKIERVTLREIFRVIEKYQQKLSIVFMGMLNA